MLSSEPNQKESQGKNQSTQGKEKRQRLLEEDKFGVTEFAERRKEKLKKKNKTENNTPIDHQTYTKKAQWLIQNDVSNSAANSKTQFNSPQCLISKHSRNSFPAPAPDLHILSENDKNNCNRANEKKDRNSMNEMEENSESDKNNEFRKDLDLFEKKMEAGKKTKLAPLSLFRKTGDNQPLPELGVEKSGKEKKKKGLLGPSKGFHNTYLNPEDGYLSKQRMHSSEQIPPLHTMKSSIHVQSSNKIGESVGKFQTHSPCKLETDSNQFNFCPVAKTQPSTNSKTNKILENANPLSKSPAIKKPKSNKFKTTSKIRKPGKSSDIEKINPLNRLNPLTSTHPLLNLNGINENMDKDNPDVDEIHQIYPQTQIQNHHFNHFTHQYSNSSNNFNHNNQNKLSPNFTHEVDPSAIKYNTNNNPINQMLSNSPSPASVYPNKEKKEIKKMKEINEVQKIDEVNEGSDAVNVNMNANTVHVEDEEIGLANLKLNDIVKNANIMINYHTYITNYNVNSPYHTPTPPDTTATPMMKSASHSVNSAHSSVHSNPSHKMTIKKPSNEAASHQTQPLAQNINTNITNTMSNLANLQKKQSYTNKPPLEDPGSNSEASDNSKAYSNSNSGQHSNSNSHSHTDWPKKKQTVPKKLYRIVSPKSSSNTPNYLNLKKKKGKNRNTEVKEYTMAYSNLEDNRNVLKEQANPYPYIAGEGGRVEANTLRQQFISNAASASSNLLSHSSHSSQFPQTLQSGSSQIINQNIHSMQSMQSMQSIENIENIENAQVSPDAFRKIINFYKQNKHQSNLHTLS